MTPLFEALRDYAGAALGALKTLVLDPGSFLSPLPIVVAIIIAGLVVLWRRSREGDAGLKTIAADLFPASVWKHKSARHDAAIILINEGFLFFLPAIAAISYLPLSDYIAIKIVGLNPATNPFILIAFGVYMALVWDFMNTFAHYLKHKVPVLWEFHKVHHCAEVLTPLTALRRHPVEILISAMISGAGTGIAIILWALVFGAPGTSYEIAGLAVIVYLWRLLGYNIRHSHIWISYGPFWNRYLISPAHHQLHHSRDPRHYDCNFGHIFTFWDRMFGTHYEPVEGETFEFGIEREENEKLGTLAALYLRPMRKAAERLAPPSRMPQARGAK